MQTKSRQQQAGELLDTALSENGVVCFHAINQPLVDTLCEIIGALHRELESRDMSAMQINAMVRSNF